MPPGKSQSRASKGARGFKTAEKAHPVAVTRHQQGMGDRKREPCTGASSNSSSLHPTFLGSWLGLKCVIYYPAMKCSLINILFIVFL